MTKQQALSILKDYTTTQHPDMNTNDIKEMLEQFKADNDFRTAVYKELKSKLL